MSYPLIYNALQNIGKEPVSGCVPAFGLRRPRLPIFFQHCEYLYVRIAVFEPYLLAVAALVHHAEFFHQRRRRFVVRRTFAHDAVQADFVESEIHNGAERA